MASYADHISEVFIKPIRSVLAIDDQFPTLDMLLSGEEATTRPANSDRLAKLLSFCRAQNPEWLVDVHNGRGLGGKGMPSPIIRQCGWLILDYKLDGDNSDASRSISVLRSLASSDHFNLVAIYTADKAETVLREVTVALSDLGSNVPLTADEASAVDAALTLWEDSEPEITELLAKEISGSACFELLRSGTTAVNDNRNTQIVAGFNRLIQNGPSQAQINPQHLLNYLVRKHLFSVIPDGARSFNVEFSSPTSTKKWIYARNIFVTIEEKTTDPAHLLDSLIDSLRDWKPSPNQLIIAKLRTELEASGMILDRGVVKDKNLQAFWLDRLLTADPREEAHYVGALVDRQSEIVGDRLRTKLIAFTKSIISDLKGEAGAVALTRQYLGIDPTDHKYRIPGIIAHNTHVSTKPPSGKNLTSGHIVKVEDGAGTSLWICLSPACDLEAGRKGGRDLKLLLQPWMPVTLVKLHKISESIALKNATRGLVIFLEINGGKEQFSCYRDADAKQNPNWEEVFVKGEGRLLNGNRLQIARIRKSRATIDLPSAKEFIMLGGTLIPAKDLPVFHEFDATVVGQLRTEYAASLNLRFTAHLSRIGLDYYGGNE